MCGQLIGLDDVDHVGRVRPADDRLAKRSGQPRDDLGAKVGSYVSPWSFGYRVIMSSDTVDKWHASW
jgi:hypothetical protein